MIIMMTLMMTFVQVVETSGSVIKTLLTPYYTHPDDHTSLTYDMTT